ncbi:MAG: 30S ribosomal protein S2 [Fibrobacterales bacterium]
MNKPTVEQLLEAGVHFGHQTSRWNPKMKPYILTERNGIHVINLRKTLDSLDPAAKAIKECIASGKKVLFVGTKITTRTVLQKTAEKYGQFYVTKRWLGGMLTNYNTVRKSIKQLEKIEKMERDGLFKELQKKEVLDLNRKREKLLDVFGGIREMKEAPGLVFIVDINHSHIAVAESKKLNVPIIAVCDSNSNPDVVDFPIPGNDDAVKSVSLILEYLTSQINEAPANEDAAPQEGATTETVEASKEKAEEV